MDVRRCLGREDYFDLVNGPEFTARWMLERHLAAAHRDGQPFTLPGFCTTCKIAVDFAVRFEDAWQSPDGLVVPNWRECMNCPGCGMNARRRMIQALVTGVLDAPDANCRTAYFMEQVSPVYDWAIQAFPRVTWTGSEYLGPALAPGSVHDGVRHEDAERLSFAPASFDVLVSCDVLEHVAHPELALGEIARVLRPGGTAILSFPMEPRLDTNKRRAERDAGGRIRHVLPPLFHRNPISAEGSLLFMDFGWQVLDQMRDAGLRDAALYVYWSYELGYLGVQFYFLAHRA